MFLRCWISRKVQEVSHNNLYFVSSLFSRQSRRNDQGKQLKVPVLEIASPVVEDSRMMDQASPGDKSQSVDGLLQKRQHSTSESSDADQELSHSEAQKKSKLENNKVADASTPEHDEAVKNMDEEDAGLWRLEEKMGDLFQCPPQTSLAHCVSADLRMGKGIAVTFKNKFGRKHELKRQGKTAGEVAVLKVDERYVYYLVTKEKFDSLPSGCKTLQQSLEAMRNHCVENDVTAVAMPRIGCGLDRLDFDDVKKVLRAVFSQTNIAITIYSL